MVTGRYGPTVTNHQGCSMFQPLFPFSYPPPGSVVDPKGVVYTKPWVVELILDLAGYTSQANLADSLAVEPAAGEGAFLVPMALRLASACLRQGRPPIDCESSLIAYELEEVSARKARGTVADALRTVGVDRPTAEHLAFHWVRAGDYLFEAPRLPLADFVIGNPPYIRLEEIPAGTVDLYRDAYPSMKGRADLYVAFFEAGLRQLKRNGACAFICPDRWMLNQYGAELRRLVTSRFSVEAIVEMHEVGAFEDDVSAYPAITLIRRAEQSRTIVASLGSCVDQSSGPALARSLRSAADGRTSPLPGGLKLAVVESWFTGSDPWPCSSPARLALIRRFEESFGSLESESSGTKVGIGVATGLDKVYITRNAGLVESSRLLPLAMAQDTTSGHFRWSGHFLVNPWDPSGLVDLEDFPLLREYLEKAESQIKKRDTARRNPVGWYRTIDRVNPPLTGQKKIYIPDIKDRLEPVLDVGETYPHHNLYFVQSSRWDLEVLGGLLLSSVVQLFIEAYGVRMRGGYLRFQAQYLRRIRVPEPSGITVLQAGRLTEAFRGRDRQLASSVAQEIYRVDPSEIENAR